MGFKSFMTKSALRLKGVSKEQAEEIAKQLEEHPEIAESLKALESNKEVKALMEKIQKEIAQKTKAGMPEMYASVQVMGKYKSEIAKHRHELEPLMRLMQK